MKALAITVAPGKRVRLADIPPDDTGPFKDKDEAAELTAANLERLAELQERLTASGSHALLVVLQAMDTGGKDGTIEHVMGAFSPQGVQVTSFKVPTEEELAHDFLWRVHKVVPRRGMVGIFNRSHYEDVLVVRVKGLAPEPVWRGRFDHINAFEKLLADSGVVIVKFFLHISPEEQARRLRARQRDPRKRWKFNPGDLEDRALWGRYMEAYEEALTRCSTPWAPWRVVPADHKWFRNLAVSQALVTVLEGLSLAYPPGPPGIEELPIPPVSW